MKTLNLTKKLKLTPFPIFILVLTFFFSTSNVLAQIKIEADGDIGIGTSSPSKAVEIESSEILFDLSGNYSPKDIRIYSYYSHAVISPSVDNGAYLGWSNLRFYYGYFNRIRSRYTVIVDSDVKFKDDVLNLNNSLDKVLKLQGVSYKLKDEFIDKKDIKGKKTQIGLIANEVINVVPEVVDYDSISDSYGIRYASLIPLLIEAIKEQNLEIEKLKTNKNQKLKSAGDDLSENNVITATLSQNRPNPFNQETTIDFYIASTISNATIYIYDLQGKQIKSMDIAQREYGNVTIYANELQPGMYKYALIADGAIVGTETMILTD